MAKKKSIKSDVDEEDELSDLDDDSLGDLEDESVFPEFEKKSTEQVKESVPTAGDLSEDEDFMEDVFEDELEPQQLDYKFISPSIVKGIQENDYELTFRGQSHGFCNIFVKHLLETEGVNIAAYKFTRIDPPKIFLRIQKGYDVKDIIRKGISSLQNEVKSVEKVFQKLM